ncbi:MAG: DUF58 domain-containing protein [Lachnospiraceae bacterium]|nr:DUF58 domain-containing protein [Lachnospiraceae bacterium]
MALIWLVAVSLALLGLTPVVFRKWWARNLSSSVSFADTAVKEGDITQLSEIVENRKALPLPTLTVKFNMDRSILFIDKTNTSRTDQQYRSDCLVVMPFQRLLRRHQVKCTARGFFTIDSMDVSCMDLLYRHLYSREYPVESRLYVYPERSHIPGLPYIFRKFYGEYITRQQKLEDPFAFRGIRDYTPTDPMNRVNWKSTARNDELKVNQFFSTSSADVTIFLNLESQGLNMAEDVLEEAIRLARTFLEYFLKDGISVRLLSNGRDLIGGEEVRMDSGSGSSHLENCLKAMARIDLKKSVRRIQNVMQEYKLLHPEADQPMSVLISGTQEGDMLLEYAKFTGNGGLGFVLLPIHESQRRYQEEIASSSVRKSLPANIKVYDLVLEHRTDFH